MADVFARLEVPSRDPDVPLRRLQRTP